MGPSVSPSQEGKLSMDALQDFFPELAKANAPAR
jgi:hypothetical protein